VGEQRGDGRLEGGPLEALSAEDLVAVMSAFRTALATHQTTINRLNVYPVPDGDTGTNMLATIEAVVREIESPTSDEESIVAGETAMTRVCRAVAQGSLMGARGNSGVILCQVLRGITQVFSPLDVAHPEDLGRALVAANEAARSAVLRPVEGTILTVAAAAATASSLAAASGQTLELMIVETRRAAVEALWSTPKLLAVLADAGVVDAGGAGLVCCSMPWHRL